MSRYAGLWVILALGAPQPGAAQVTIEGPDRVDAGRLATFAAGGADLGKAGFQWDVSPCDRADLVEMGPRLVLTGPAGTYRIRLRVVRATADGVSIDSAVKLLTVAGPPATTIQAAVSLPAVSSPPQLVQVPPSAPVVVPSGPPVVPSFPLQAGPVLPALPERSVLLAPEPALSRGLPAGGLLERRLERRELRALEAPPVSRFRGIGVGFERGRGLRCFIGAP